MRDWKCKTFGDTPDERILFALEAMREVEKMEGIDIWMSDYHFKDSSNGLCYACCGGAAALKKWVPKENWLDIETRVDIVFGPKTLQEIAHYESSLDYARVGDVGGMFFEMGLLPQDDNKLFRDIADYHRTPEQFYIDMEALAADIKTERLK